MDEGRVTEQAKVEREITEEAQRLIEQDLQDPRQQKYMFNKSTGLLIKTNGQYHHALENKHEIEVISYKRAEQIYREEDAKKKKALARIQQRKTAKRARKENRGH